jgi:hypothetical protein
MTEIKTRSNLTCPECGFTKELEMPMDYCQISYECENCKTTLTPKEGTCCVFCSYADIPCPPKQK